MKKNSKIGQQKKFKHYPLFYKPEEYMHFRSGGPFKGWFKQFFEHRAIKRALKGLDIETVCDCPCGPGRLFPFWKKEGFEVTAGDLSESMVEAASRYGTEFGYDKPAIYIDAFKLYETLDSQADMVASVRFAYYFDSNDRIELLKSLARASKKYLLIQYKTHHTTKGQRNYEKELRRNRAAPKYFCSYQQIISEIEKAGLVCRRIVPIADSSDRVFVLAQKNNKLSKCKTKIHRPLNLTKTGKFAAVAAAIIIMAGMLIPKTRAITDPEEYAIEDFVAEHQDGNDVFFVYDAPYLEDLRFSKELVQLSANEPITSIINSAQSGSRDLHFLLSTSQVEKYVSHFDNYDINLLKRIEFNGRSYLIFSTEDKLQS